jgi:ribosomal protein S18 acetylase RimI-like enzyme
MDLICAGENDYEAVRDFYYELIDEMKDAKFKPGWEKDVYPTQEFLLESIRTKELFYTPDPSNIQACMIVNHRYNEGYKDVKWSVEASEEELLVIHALGVLPRYSGRGIAKQLVQEVIHQAELQNIKTIRLDILDGNIPAEKAYTKAGFQYVTTLRLYYEDTGWTNFKLFEYIV